MTVPDPRVASALPGFRGFACGCPIRLSRQRRFRADIGVNEATCLGDRSRVIAATFESRERFLCDITLDPPAATGDLAGPPLLDEDYLILSTIHSAKGQEWQIVYVLRVVDGCIPSDMACGSTEEIDEERRLLYVAMTRAKSELHLIHPQRFYTHKQARRGDRHVYAPRSRFVPSEIVRYFDQGPGRSNHTLRTAPASPPKSVTINIAAELRDMWG